MAVTLPEPTTETTTGVAPLTYEELIAFMDFAVDTYGYLDGNLFLNSLGLHDGLRLTILDFGAKLWDEMAWDVMPKLQADATFQDWQTAGMPTAEEFEFEQLPPEEQELDLDTRLREAIDAIQRTGRFDYQGNEDLQPYLADEGYALFTTGLAGGTLPESSWYFGVAVEEELDAVQEFFASDRTLFGRELSDGTYVDWNNKPTTLEAIQAEIDEYEVGLVQPTPPVPEGWTYDNTTGVATDPDGNRYVLGPDGESWVLLTPEGEEEPLDWRDEIPGGVTWVAPNLLQGYDGSFYREDGTPVDGELGNMLVAQYMDSLSPEEQDELTAYQEENIRIQDERLELERQRMAQAGEETPLERAQRIAFEAQQFAGAENWITRWQMEELQREDEYKQKRKAAHQRASEMMQAASELPFGSEERLQAEMATERAWDALANMRPFEPSGPPPAPAFPEFQELTGFAPGEQIAPGFTTLASGQTMSALSPSQMGGITGFVDFSAGQVPGAWASAEDYWAEALGMLPTSVPRGTVRWSPSPYRV